MHKVAGQFAMVHRLAAGATSAKIDRAPLKVSREVLPQTSGQCHPTVGIAASPTQRQATGRVHRTAAPAAARARCPAIVPAPATAVVAVAAASPARRRAIGRVPLTVAVKATSDVLRPAIIPLPAMAVVDTGRARQRVPEVLPATAITAEEAQCPVEIVAEDRAAAVVGGANLRRSVGP